MNSCLSQFLQRLRTLSALLLLVAVSIMGQSGLAMASLPAGDPILDGPTGRRRGVPNREAKLHRQATLRQTPTPAEPAPPENGELPDAPLSDAVGDRILLPLIQGGVGQDEPPLAVADAYDTLEDTSLAISAAEGVLANDVVTGSDAVGAELVDDAAQGLLRLNPDGSFTYTPPADFAGEDAFAYQAVGGSQRSNPVQVTLTIIPVNDAPTAVADSYELTRNEPLIVNAANGVLANDADPEQDPLKAVLVGDPTDGALALSEDGSFAYTPNSSLVSEDSFRYVAYDGTLPSNLVTVTMAMGTTNGPPVAIDDQYAIAADSPLEVDAANGVLANDSDPEQDPLEAILVSDVAQGVLNLDVDGAFTYAPSVGFEGQDRFTYLATDGLATSNIAEVILTVGRNSAPQIVTGEIAFTKEVIGTDVNETHFAVAADLDRDGDIDVAATDYIDDLLLWYENDGNGVFTERVLDGELEGAYPAAIGDVNRDGHMDVLAGGYQGDIYRWYRNDGDGYFTAFDIDTTADGAHSIIPADLDEDGDIDFVFANQDANTIGWYENDGSQRYTGLTVDTDAQQAKRAEAADVDSDGDLDLVAANTNSHEIAWYENDGNELFAKHIVDREAYGAYYVVAADLDGDVDVDLMRVGQWDNTVSWYRNDGAQNFTQLVIDRNADGARALFPVDMDRDGDLDIVAASVNDDTIAWYENDGGNFTKRYVDEGADGAYGVFAVDFDSDGDPDVVSASRDSNEIAVHSQIQLHRVTMSPGSDLTIGSDILQTIDEDDGPVDLIYEIIIPPASGELRLGNMQLKSGGTFTQFDVDSARLSYVQAGDAGSTDSFVFSVGDGGENGAGMPIGHFEIEITAEVVSMRD